MKKVFAMVLIISIVFGILALGNDEAEAMNTGEAILLGGAIAIFGRPILQAIVGEIFCPMYNQPTQIIYVPAPNYNSQPIHVPRTAYERGLIDEQLRIEREREQYDYWKGRQDGRRFYYGE